MSNWLKDKFRNAFRRQASDEAVIPEVPAQDMSDGTAEENSAEQSDMESVEMEVRELSDEERASLAEIPEEGPMFSAEQLQIMSAEKVSSCALADLSASIADRFAEEIPEETEGSVEMEVRALPAETETEAEDTVEMEVRELSDEERASLAEIPEEGPMFSAKQLQIMSAEQAPSGALSDLSASVADRFAEENREEDVPEKAEAEGSVEMEV